MADDDIEQCLRRITRDLSKKGDVTVNQVRTQVESDLDLESGYLKQDEWRTRSKDIIKNAMDEPESPAKPAPKAKVKPAAKAGTKRKSDDDKPAKSKRARKAVNVEPDSEEDTIEPDVEDEEFDAKPRESRAKKPAKKPAPKIESDDDEVEVASKVEEDDDEAVEDASKTVEEPAKPSEESELSDVPEDLEAAPAANGKPTAAEDDESDMSSLIDELPARKKRQKKTASSETKSKSKTAAKAKPKNTKSDGKELSSDEEEIKRLQGWLVKCGIRRLWHRELASCSSSKEKIKHLKGMLEDAGMTGRYSAEKAKQIKEARELADELEAAQEYNRQWGQDDEASEEENDDDGDDAEESKTDAPPARRMPKGFVDFGDSGDDGSD